MYRASFIILCYDQQMHSYLTNITHLQAPWGWHDIVETCRSVIISEIIVHLLVIVQNNKIILEFSLKYSGMPQKLSTGSVNILAEIKNGSPQNTIQKR